MTFQTEGGDVPLGWGQFVFFNRAVPAKKKTKSKSKKQPAATPVQVLFGTVQQRLAIGMLALVNLSLIGNTMVNGTQANQVQQVREVQAMVAPTPVAESVKIQPVAEPKAVTAAITAVAATPTPTPTARVAAVSASRIVTTPQVGNWDALLQQHFGGNWLRAKKVMLCESGGNARAVGPRDSQGYNPIGLFQIKNFPGRPSTTALMDAATNVAWAAKMSGAGSNWRAWQCKP